MPAPDNSVRLGFYDSNDDDEPRAVWVAMPAYEAFAIQLRTVLANPAPIKAMVRARVSAMVGPQFDGETDDWVYECTRLASVLFGIPNAEEDAKLKAELLA
jgi:hypothetical protein